MSVDKSFSINMNARVAVGAALGVGLVAGAGTAYLISRLNEHTRLTHQISSLHATIMEVKRDIALLETELEHLNDQDRSLSAPVSRLSSRSSTRPSSRSSSSRKKTVSFCSTTSGSYHTAPGYDTDTSLVLAAGYDTDASRNTDTDYYSPDEDDDEFFDLTPEDSKTITYMGVNVVDEDAGSETEASEVFLEGLVEGVEDKHLTLLLQQVDQLSDGSPHDQTQAFHLLRSESHQYTDNAEFQWRLAKTTRNMAAVAEKAGNQKEKEALIFEAYSYAERSLELAPGNADVHKWYGILCGMRGEYLGLGERVRSGNEFKKHIDQALKLRPQDATLHHLLGRFCFEVSQLSWLERRAAAALFGEVPASSFEEAARHFEAAEELGPAGWKENSLFLAKCQVQLGNMDMAVVWLERARDAPIVTADDDIVHREVLELLQKYS